MNLFSLLFRFVLHADIVPTAVLTVNTAWLHDNVNTKYTFSTIVRETKLCLRGTLNIQSEKWLSPQG